MSIYLELFLAFLEVGTFAFGGGYGMISLMREKALQHAWLTEEELLNVIAVAESTPGPIALNMATFVGSTQAGILGSIIATVAVVIPSFIIILLIAAVLKNFMNYRGVKGFLFGVRPVVVALILATGVNMLLHNLFGIASLYELSGIDAKGIIILLLLFAIGYASKKLLRKKPSPILMIVLSAGLGILFYSF